MISCFKSNHIIQFIRAIRSQINKISNNQRFIDYWRKRGVEISDTVIITMGNNAHLHIGKGTNIGCYTILDLSDDPNLYKLNNDIYISSTLEIGENTAINEFNNIRAAGGKIKIGSNCLISQYVSIIATNHSINNEGLIRDAPWNINNNYVEISDDVWIGTHVVVLPGVKIGKGCVLAAGSIVTRNIPDYAIVGGIPAELIRFRPHK